MSNYSEAEDRTTCGADCSRPIRTRGFCHGHYLRLWEGKTGEELTKPLEARPCRGGCSIEGCPREHHGRGYCQRHYSRKYILGWPDERLDESFRVVDPERGCKVSSCSDQHAYRGFCGRHARLNVDHGVSADWLEDHTECEICGAEDSLCVDHDHKTGEVRGTLCRFCNVSIGHFNDDPRLLRAAADYLETHEGDD